MRRRRRCHRPQGAHDAAGDGANRAMPASDHAAAANRQCSSRMGNQTSGRYLMLIGGAHRHVGLPHLALDAQLGCRQQQGQRHGRKDLFERVLVAEATHHLGASQPGASSSERQVHDEHDPRCVAHGDMSQRHEDKSDQRRVDVAARSGCLDVAPVSQRQRGLTEVFEVAAAGDEGVGRHGRRIVDAVRRDRPEPADHGKGHAQRRQGLQFKRSRPA